MTTTEVGEHLLRSYVAARDRLCQAYCAGDVATIKNRIRDVRKAQERLRFLLETANEPAEADGFLATIDDDGCLYVRHPSVF